MYIIEKAIGYGSLKWEFVQDYDQEDAAIVQLEYFRDMYPEYQYRLIKELSK